MDRVFLPPPDPLPPPDRRRSGAPLPQPLLPQPLLAGEQDASSQAGAGRPVSSLVRTLDQELVALLRGVSLECPVCGEFVMHVQHAIVCPECGIELRDDGSEPVGAPPGVLAPPSGAR